MVMLISILSFFTIPMAWLTVWNCTLLNVKESKPAGRLLNSKYPLDVVSVESLAFRAVTSTFSIGKPFTS